MRRAWLLLALLALLALPGCADRQGAYEDAKEQEKYASAMALLEQEDFAGAEAAFRGLGEFRDAQRQTAYAAARYQYRLQAYDRALEQFRALGDFSDAARYAAFLGCFAALDADALTRAAEWEDFPYAEAQRVYDRLSTGGAIDNAAGAIRRLRFLKTYNALVQDEARRLRTPESVVMEAESLAMLRLEFSGRDGGRAAIVRVDQDGGCKLDAAAMLALPDALFPASADEVSYLIAAELSKTKVGFYIGVAQGLDNGAYKLCGTVCVYRTGLSQAVWSGERVAGGEPPAAIYGSTAAGTEPELDGELARAVRFLTGGSAVSGLAELGEGEAAEALAAIYASMAESGFDAGGDAKNPVFTDYSTFSGLTAGELAGEEYADTWRMYVEQLRELSAAMKLELAVYGVESVRFCAEGRDGKLAEAEDGALVFDAAGPSS